MSGPADRGVKGIATRLGGPGMTAVALMTAAAIVTATTIPGLVGAIFVPTPSPFTLPSDAAKDQSARMEAARKQIDGRTMFFVPAKPPPPKPVVEVKHEDTGPPPTPPPPSTYGGPAPIAMVFDTVWFADGQKLKAGDEAKGDLQVVRLEAPWAAIVKWKGVEFTVKFFERDSTVIRKPGEAMAVGTPAGPKPATPPAVETAAPAPVPAASGDPTPPSDQPPGPPADPATDAPAGPPPSEPSADPESNR